MSFIYTSLFLMICRSYVCKARSSNDDANGHKEQESLRDKYTDRGGNFRGSQKRDPSRIDAIFCRNLAKLLNLLGKHPYRTQNLSPIRRRRDLVRINYYLVSGNKV